jgi:hypothetical protein
VTPEPLPLPEVGGVSPAPNPTPVFPEGGSSGKSQTGKKGKGKRGGEGGTGGVGPGVPPAVPPGEAATIPETGSPIEPQDGESFSTGEPADESDSGGSGSVLGSIIAGLVVGGILFAIGYGPYKRWQSTRGGPGAPGASPTGAQPTVPPGAGAAAVPGAPNGGPVPPPAAAAVPPAAAAPQPAVVPNPPEHTPVPINAAPPSGPPRSL